jgi:hypothetical protein
MILQPSNLRSGFNVSDREGEGDHREGSKRDLMLEGLEVLRLRPLR